MTFENVYKTAMDRLTPHMGHEIEIATYGGENLAIECMDCHEVLVDFPRLAEGESDDQEAVFNPQR